MKRLCVIALLLVSSLVFKQNVEAAVYGTWDVLEVDPCASAWLLKRFIDKEATFKFYPKGELITNGIPFDTPESELRRKGNSSAFEVIVAKYKIKDPKIMAIGKLVHQIEIAYWKEQTDHAAEDLKEKIGALIKEKDNPEKILKKTFLVFDELYEKF